MKCFTIYNLLIINSVSGQQKFQLNVGDEINVLSDKGYYHNNGKFVEAVGNVIIIHNTETLYGDTATFDMEKGLFHIEGNVRYITQEMTLYGSEIDYDLNTQQIRIKNVRVLNNLYSIVAKEVFRKNPTLYEFTDAEYTTCKDCPESWSVFGNKVSLTVNEYVQIKNCLIKVKGTSVLYVPYLIFPIKRGRETGVLFPNLNLRTNDGDFGFQIPFFWAISQNKDLTIAPTAWSKTGYGADFEYRHAFADQQWLNVNSRFVDDTQYFPLSRSREEVGNSFFRHYSDAEAHMRFGQNWNSHFLYSTARDMDYLNNQFIYTSERLLGAELGFDGFIEGRSSIFSFGIEGKIGENMIVADPTQFDEQYVQVLPRLNLAMSPLNIFSSEIPGIENISVGMKSNFVSFAQSSPIELNQRQTYTVDSGQIPLLRNAQRLTIEPYMDWSFYTKGALNISSNLAHRYQAYSFNEEGQENFFKGVSTLRTEASLSFEKIFGLAYQKDIPKELVLENQNEDRDSDKAQEARNFEALYREQIVGKLQPFKKDLTDPYVQQIQNSYRHATEYKLIHYYVPFEQERGNNLFRQQISERSREGWFDYEDAIFSLINQTGDNETRTDISPANTLEFQWNNSLVRKQSRAFNYLEDQRYLRDNFSYSEVGYFNISQGLEIDTGKTGVTENLTRLHIQTGMRLDQWRARYNQFYFHQNGTQRTVVGLDYLQDRSVLGVDFRYDNVANRDIRLISGNASFTLLDTFQIFINRNYDISQGAVTSSMYAINYRPVNDCWMIGLNYRENLNDSFIGFNIMMNLGGEWLGQGG